MSALDKSLDDIISNTRKAPRAKVRGTKGKIGKKVGSSNKKPIVSFKKAAPPTPKKAPAVDMSYATKVVVYGLPKDLKTDAVKDFFQSQVGGVQNVALAYNEKGHFKGIATIIFKSNKNAALAVEKYNGAPIDGGSTKLKLELIIDPTKKPLASRIAPNKVVSAASIKAKLKANLKNSKTQKPQKAPKKKTEAPGKKQKPPKKTKKTVEQLDQEMADYFDN